MKYILTASSIAHQTGTIIVKHNAVGFGITSQKELLNPAELLLGAFAACCLKSVERFSKLLKFEYDDARIEVVGLRQEKPTKLIEIQYILYINSQDPSLNLPLLHKNIQQYGTIYNTLKASCAISGALEIVEEVINPS